MKKIMIQGAMDIEVRALLAAMGECREVILHGWQYYEGTLAGAPVIVAKTNIGMVNATASTLLGLEHFRPDAIINQGTAGAHDPCLHTGDIVIGERVMNAAAFQSQRAAKGEGISLVNMEQLPLEVVTPQGVVQRTQFRADTGLLEAAQRAASGQAHIHVGTISSADIWNREQDRLLWAHETYGSTAEEMEAAAVYQVAAAFAVPVIAIRIISNSEHHEADWPFRPEVSDRCADFITRVIREYAG